jgi:hypothetical protein
MKPIKDIISNLFSPPKKKDEGVSLEIENEQKTEEDTEHKTDIKDDSKSTKYEEHETEFKNERIIQKDEDIADDSEWEKRVLCSDGNCIGIIGQDGHCKECGKAFNNDSEHIDDHNDNVQESDTLQADKEIISDEQEFFSRNQEKPFNSEDSNTEDSESDMEWDLESDLEWDNRTLCSDGNCIGVIGPDGRCKECGKPYQE